MTLADWKKSQIQKRNLLLQLRLHFLFPHLLPLLHVGCFLCRCSCCCCCHYCCCCCCCYLCFHCFFVVIVVIVDVVLVVVVVVVIFFIVVVVASILFFLPLFLCLHLDFFFSQKEPTFLVMTDKGIEIDCLTIVQFCWVKSSSGKFRVCIWFVSQYQNTESTIIFLLYQRLVDYIEPMEGIL